MNWTKEQEQAIYKNKSNILVAAAAGSGKTAVLVERIINKIINEHIDIDKILVVTFTNAAASEMRERIFNAIYKKIDESENDAEIQNLQRQITLINKANICTIDSFCLDVIRNNFFETNISPNFRIADNNEIELLKMEVLDELFEGKYEAKDKDFQDLIKTYTSYRDDTPLKDLIVKIFTYISSSPYPRKWLKSQIEKFNIKDENIDFSETQWGKILLDEMKEELTDDIAVLDDESKKLSVDKDLLIFQKTLENDSYELQTLLANLDNWDKAYEIANKVEFIKWSVKKFDSLEKDEAKYNAKNVRDSVKKKFNEKRDKIFVSTSKEAIDDINEMYQLLVKLENLIYEFENKFTEKKKERNILDFSDVEHLALDILVAEKEDGTHTRTEVAKKYQNRFNEIAIDEYQDSNLVQEYILTSVSKGNNIFMVGDVKQSIYKFRQARPELFLDKYKKYNLNETNNYGLKIQLFKNFRSRENILDLTNLIFKNIMSYELGEIDYNKEEYLNLGAKWDEVKLKNEVDIIDINDEGENKKESDLQVDDDENEENENIEDIELEAKFVSKKIRELIDSKFQIYDLKSKNYRNIKYRDIAILIRSTKGKAPIFEKELMECDIPVYSDMSSDYIDSIEIQTILALLKIIDNPIQDIPLVTVMRSSIGKFTDNELVEIRLADRNSNFYEALQKAKLSVSEELKEKIDEFLNQLQKWREEQEYLSLDELIWQIYEDTGFLDYMGILPNGELRQANLRMLFERAKSYESASFKGLFNFIRFIERLSLSSGDMSSAKMIGENDDVVRIMSIHKSKGLEFPIVFLVSTSSKFNLMDLNMDILLDQDLGIGVKYIDYDKQIKYDTLTKLAIKEKALNSTISEEMRILYVALTRAKEKIYIVGKSKDFEKLKQKIYDELNIYKNEKINPILIKKHQNYLEWILLAYYHDFEKMKENLNVNVYKKLDLIKSLKPEEKQEIDLFKLLEENSKNVTDEEIAKLKNELDFTYKYKSSTTIPSKTSITAIAHKDIEKIKSTILTEEEYLNPIKSEDENEIEFEKNLSEDEEEIKFEKPKFLSDDEEEVTAGKRGTIIHLIMKNLDFSKEYQLKDIEDLIEALKNKEIITGKEANSVDKNQILQFTKSEIWKELKNAKSYYKEEPFYINIPAKEIEDTDSNENILAQGIIDLYYITDEDKLVLLDYKTDFVKSGEEDILINRHKDQLLLYRDALENSLNRKVDKIYIYSVTLGKIVTINSF